MEWHYNDKFQHKEQDSYHAKLTFLISIISVYLMFAQAISKF